MTAGTQALAIGNPLTRRGSGQADLQREKIKKTLQFLWSACIKL
jgi:hypothetical protein